MTIIEKPIVQDFVEKIKARKKAGVKIIGFTCSFVPEELIYAAQAFPLRLNLGGDEEIALKGGELMSVGTCPYGRSTLGYFLKHHPLYSLCDLVVTGNFCNAMETIQDYSKYIEIPTINLDVPRRTDEISERYFYKELAFFKEKLENFCGSKIPDPAIQKSIEIYNELRKNLKELNILRRQSHPALTGAESSSLVQTLFLSDKIEFIQDLKDLLTQLNGREIEHNGKRVMISGSNIALDDEIIQIIEDLGGIVVGDDFCAGMRYYWDNVEYDEDPLRALARRYLTKIPCARMYPDAARFDFIREICDRYKVSGLINYNLKFCDPFQLKKLPLKTFVQNELNIPVLIIEREYTEADRMQIQTRVQAFLEML